MRILIILFLLFNTAFAWQLDKKVSLDDDGFWGAHYDVPEYFFIGVAAISIFEGTESRIGRTSWNAMEAGAIALTLSEVTKKVSGRKRPRHTESSSDWGEGGKSFFSGHVTGMTAIITPYVLEYQDDYPLVHLLWSLTAYQMVGRVKDQAHWQSDTIVAALVGFASGYLTWKISTPLVLSFTKDSSYIGLRYRF